MGGQCLSVPMPLVLDSLDGCRDNSPASIFVVSAMCQWSWSILTDAYAQESWKAVATVTIIKVVRLRRRRWQIHWGICRPIFHLFRHVHVLQNQPSRIRSWLRQMCISPMRNGRRYWLHTVSSLMPTRSYLQFSLQELSRISCMTWQRKRSRNSRKIHWRRFHYRNVSTFSTMLSAEISRTLSPKTCSTAKSVSASPWSRKWSRNLMFKRNSADFRRLMLFQTHCRSNNTSRQPSIQRKAMSTVLNLQKAMSVRAGIVRAIMDVR